MRNALSLNDKEQKGYIYIFKPLNWEPVIGLQYAHHESQSKKFIVIVPSIS